MSNAAPIRSSPHSRIVPLPVVAQIADSTIRNAVDSVFNRPEFNRYSLWERLWGWVIDLIARIKALLGDLLGSTRDSSPVFWTLVALVAILVAGIIGRAVYLWYRRRQLRADAPRWESDARHGRGTDPWTAANALAASGNFTDAAHALYAALLEAAARQQQIRLHPSKTVGDYVRELRAHSSSFLARFRDFARSYEAVIYGVGYCDQERYLRLHALATSIVGPHG